MEEGEESLERRLARGKQALEQWRKSYNNVDQRYRAVLHDLRALTERSAKAAGQTESIAAAALSAATAKAASHQADEMAHKALMMAADATKLAAEAASSALILA